MKIGISLCVVSSLALGGVAGAESGAEIFRDPMAEQLFSDLGASAHECPDSLASTLPRDQAAQCASLELDAKQFKKQLKQALKELDDYRVLAVGGWSKLNDRWSVRSYRVGRAPTWIAFSESDNGLMVIRGWLPLSCPGSDEIFAALANDFDKRPELIRSTHVSADWPDGAPRRSADVMLHVRIDPEGVPEVLCALNADPAGMGFEGAAAAAIQQWRYEPAQKDGKPVPATMSVVVSWDVQ